MSFTMTPSQIIIFNNMVRNIASLVNVPPSNSRLAVFLKDIKLTELEQKLQKLEQDKNLYNNNYNKLAKYTNYTTTTR